MVRGLGLFVGQGICNARCPHCAGVQHRKHAPLEDGEIPIPEMTQALLHCHDQGAQYISLSGSGEPTLSPRAITRTLNLISRLTPGKKINLYTNGIGIGVDAEFERKWFPAWKTMGLTDIYLTVHHPDEVLNAQGFGIETYPDLSLIIKRIKNHFKLRVNLVLKPGGIDTAAKLVTVSEQLFALGVDRISAWPIRDPQDKVAPGGLELEAMIALQTENLLVLVNQEVIYEAGEKLTLFPDGQLLNTWCV